MFIMYFFFVLLFRNIKNKVVIHEAFCSQIPLILTFKLADYTKDIFSLN